jgi:uncharacterized protein YceK
MKKIVTASTAKLSIMLLLIFVAFELSGCSSVGKVIPEQNRILFNKNGTNQGTYKAEELTLDYNYTLDGRNLSFDGNITSVWDFDSVDLSLLFIDATGTVLQSTVVYYSGYRDQSPSASTDSTDSNFKTRLIVPRGAVGMSFSMTGMEHEGHQI